MTTSNQQILKTITELFAAGYSAAKVKAYLTLEDYSAKEISAGMKAYAEQNGKPKAKTFANEFYSWMSQEPRSQFEASDYIMGLGEFGETSQNVKKHLSHYMNIWALADSIWAQKEQPAAGMGADEPEMDADLKAAWAVYEAAKSKHEAGEFFTRAEANRIHPDKVAKFNDEELTKAYNELSKVIRIKKRSRKAA